MKFKITIGQLSLDDKQRIIMPALLWAHRYYTVVGGELRIIVLAIGWWRWALRFVWRWGAE